MPLLLLFAVALLMPLFTFCRLLSLERSFFLFLVLFFPLRNCILVTCENFFFSYCDHLSAFYIQSFSSKIVRQKILDLVMESCQQASKRKDFRGTRKWRASRIHTVIILRTKPAKMRGQSCCVCVLAGLLVTCSVQRPPTCVSIRTKLRKIS